MIGIPTASIDAQKINEVQILAERQKRTCLSGQNLMLSYLSMSPNANSSSIIQSKTNVTHQEGLKCDILGSRLNIRQQQLKKLSYLVGSQESKININNKLIQEICQLLNQIRDNNLEIAQAIININREHTITQGTSSLQCKQLLLNLSIEINLLKNSFLNRFIMFEQEYDPFFLHHYEMRHKKGILFNHPSIDQLFKLNINYASRLIRAKKSIDSLLNQANNQTKTFKRKSKSLVPQKKLSIIGNEKVENDARKTKSNFKVRTRLINKINEANKLTPTGICENSRSKEQINLAVQDDQSHFSNKIAPIKFRKHTVLPKTHFLKGLKKKKSIETQKMSLSTSKYSFNFKHQLSPLTNESQQEKKQQMSSSSWIKHELQLPIGQFQANNNEKAKQHQQQKSDLKSTNDSQKQQLKMRSRKLTLSELFQYIKSLNIAQQIKNQALNKQGQFTFSQHQSYLSQFLINKQLKAVGACLVLPNGDYLIKLWAPLASCSKQMSKHIFCKYLEYLQKLTQSNYLLYYGNFKQLVLSLQFIAKSDKLFIRTRLLPKLQKQHQFSQFLSLKCSNISFSQRNQQVNMLYSDQIQSFTQNNYYILPALAEIRKESINQSLLLAAKISNDIVDMKALNSLLEDQQFDTYEVTSAMKITNIQAIRIAQNLQFKTPFIAGEGYFKFDGQEIYRKDNSLICQIQANQANCCILLGKGFSSINSFVNSCKSKRRKRCQFSIKMFSKQLYGRMINNSINLCSYANWQFSLSWKDQIQGRIKHNMTVCDTFGSQPFYFGMQMESELVFCFQVKDSDHLY